MDSIKSAMEDKFKYSIERTPGTTRGMLIEAMLSYHSLVARVAETTITGKLSVAEESTKFSYTESKNAVIPEKDLKVFFLQIVYT